MVTKKNSNECNVLTFHFSPGADSRITPFIDGKSLLTHWDLGGKFIALSQYELVDPILALDEICLKAETVRLDYFIVASCGCGFTGCGAVTCNVTLEFGEMVWEDFSSGSSSPSLPIGPFRFDWDQVVRDLRKAREAWQKTVQKSSHS